MSADIADWTTGTEALLYQRCRSCNSVWYFRRGFCPSCGVSDVEALPSKGSGVVHAATLVCRPATAEARAHVPFMIADLLVDLTAEEHSRDGARRSRPEDRRRGDPALRKIHRPHRAVF